MGQPERPLQTSPFGSVICTLMAIVCTVLRRRVFIGRLRLQVRDVSSFGSARGDGDGGAAWHRQDRVAFEGRFEGFFQEERAGCMELTALGCRCRLWLGSHGPESQGSRSPRELRISQQTWILPVGQTSYRGLKASRVPPTNSQSGCSA